MRFLALPEPYQSPEQPVPIADICPLWIELWQNQALDLVRLRDE
ncbi:MULTISPECIES: hypothetical protein [unclassified Crossiella]|nr:MULTISPECIES: hypothetical protein [unclassified Crossiella]